MNDFQSFCLIIILCVIINKTNNYYYLFNGYCACPEYAGYASLDREWEERGGGDRCGCPGGLGQGVEDEDGRVRGRGGYGIAPWWR